MITSVIEQTFYVFRACTVNHGYSEDICYNINEHEEINNEVQVSIYINPFLYVIIIRLGMSNSILNIQNVSLIEKKYKNK